MISNEDGNTITICMNGDGYAKERNFPIPPNLVQNSCACCWGRCSRRVREYEIRNAFSNLFDEKMAVNTLAHDPKKLAAYLYLIYSKFLPGDTAKKYAKDWAMLIHMVVLHGFECVLDEDGNKVFPQIHPCGSGGGGNDAGNAAADAADADERNGSGAGGGN